MGRRKRREARQSDRLTELGCGQDVPQDEFSDQPGSSGRIGGVRGAQEYGIEGGIAGEQENEEASDTVDKRLLADAEAASSGLAEYSTEGAVESEEAEEVYDVYGDEYMSGEDLKSTIIERLASNNYLHSESVEVNVQPIGRVILSGSVETDSEVLRVSEIVGALPGVREIENNIAARRPAPCSHVASLTRSI